MNLLSERALRARWSLSRTSIYRLRKQGKLPFVLIGESVRYRLADVEDFERDHYHDAVVVGIKRRSAAR